jgi:DUF1365 family protein
MGLPDSSIYVGRVDHCRLTPREHAFRYPVFQAFLDLDRLDELSRVSPLVSRNRINWASIHDADYLPDRPEGSLRARFEAAAREAGHEPPKGPVFLLANLRYLGYCFNPVAYYYAFDENGRLALICAEITNTPWKERHRYWMKPTQVEAGKGAWVFEMPKVFHVSPFMPMNLRYRWSFSEPGEELRIHMSLFEAERLCFTATLDLARRPWQASEIHRTLVRFPWITLKVVVAIHWEALCLWMKRVPVFTHPKKVGPSGG